MAYGHLDRERTGRVWLGVCVAEGHTGKGHGQEIIEELFYHAKEHEISEIVLSVDGDNAPAIALYKKAGFAEYSVLMKRKV